MLHKKNNTNHKADVRAIELRIQAIGYMSNEVRIYWC